MVSTVTLLSGGGHNKWLDVGRLQRNSRIARKKHSTAQPMWLKLSFDWCHLLPDAISDPICIPTPPLLNYPTQNSERQANHGTSRNQPPPPLALQKGQQRPQTLQRPRKGLGHEELRPPLRLNRSREIKSRGRAQTGRGPSSCANPYNSYRNWGGVPIQLKHLGFNASRKTTPDRVLATSLLNRRDGFQLRAFGATSCRVCRAGCSTGRI